MAAVVPAIDPASSLGTGGRALDQRDLCRSFSLLHEREAQKRVTRLDSLPLKAVISSQQPLVLLVCTELDGGIRDDSHHGGRVPPPQTEETILQVGAVDQPVSFLECRELVKYLIWINYLVSVTICDFYLFLLC